MTSFHYIDERRDSPLRSSVLSCDHLQLLPRKNKVAATWSVSLTKVLSQLLCSLLATGDVLEVVQLMRSPSLCFSSAAREG